MANTAFLPLPVDRWVPAYRTVRLIGIDATLSSSRLEVRYGGDVPGAPLLRIDSTATPGAPGIRLLGVSYESGGPISTFELVIGEASIAVLPFSGARGVEAELAYDWVITIGGRKRVLAGGPFVVLPGVTGADASPAQRPSAFTTARAWHATDLTFGGGEVIEVSVDGVTLLTPYVDAARSAADASIAAAAEARARSDASAADARATGMDRAQVAADRVQAANDRAQGQAARDATLAAITGAGGTIATPALVMPALTIAALKAAAIPANGTLAQLLEPGRVGLFRFDTSDLTALVAADPHNGLYVPPNAGTTGAKGAWVRVVTDTQHEARWWGIEPGATGMSDRCNRALRMIPSGSVFAFGPGVHLMTKASANSIPNPGSNGIKAAIYCDKPVTIQGCGDVSTLDGGGGAFDIIDIRASNSRVTRIRVGNVAGQLITNEAAGIAIEPSAFAQGSGVGANIENFTVEDVSFYDSDSGVTIHPEADLGVSPKKQWLASGLDVINCRFRGVRRQGVELFQADRSTVRDCDYIGGDKTYNTSRFVRQIGSKSIVISGNRARAPLLSGGYFAVHIETAGFYSDPAYYEICRDTIVTDNIFENWLVSLQVEESRGFVLFNDNQIIIPTKLDASYSGQVPIAIRVGPNGVRDPNGSTTDRANKLELVHIEARDNVARGVVGFILSNGRVISADIEGNTMFGQIDRSDSYFSIWNTTGNHPLEKTYRVNVRDNTAYMSPNASESGVNRFLCTNPEATYDFNGNKMTPTPGGAIFVFAEPGTLILDSVNSNTTLAHDILADSFSPAKGNLFSGSLA